MALGLKPLKDVIGDAVADFWARDSTNSDGHGQVSLPLARIPTDVAAVVGPLIDARLTPDVAYMPVPRCESCGHWNRGGSTARRAVVGTCLMPQDALSAPTILGGRPILTVADFGCVRWTGRRRIEDARERTDR